MTSPSPLACEQIADRLRSQPLRSQRLACAAAVRCEDVLYADVV